MTNPRTSTNVCKPGKLAPTKAPQTSGRSSSKYWRQTFVDSYGNHQQVTLPEGTGLRGPLREAIKESLPTFQLGETGTGEKLQGAAKATGDGDYLKAIELFVIEEQEHARLLALILDDLQQPLLTSHWSDAVFVFLRHRAGLCTEVLTLLIAELVSATYYRLLRDGCQDAPVADIFARIHADEERHLEFHLTTLPGYLRKWPGHKRLVARIVWNVAARATAVVVAVDHRRLLKVCQMKPKSFIAEVWASIADTDRQLFISKEKVVDPKEGGITFASVE